MEEDSRQGEDHAEIFAARTSAREGGNTRQDGAHDSQSAPLSSTLLESAQPPRTIPDGARRDGVC